MEDARDAAARQDRHVCSGIDQHRDVVDGYPGPPERHRTGPKGNRE
jgi:hypothetical protein